MQLVWEFKAAVWSQILACGIIQHSLYEFLFMLHLSGTPHLFPTLNVGAIPSARKCQDPNLFGPMANNNTRGLCSQVYLLSCPLCWAFGVVHCSRLALESFTCNIHQTDEQEPWGLWLTFKFIYWVVGDAVDPKWPLGNDLAYGCFLVVVSSSLVLEGIWIPGAVDVLQLLSMVQVLLAQLRQRMGLRS